ncbi:MAG: PRC-barrel domain-containing protein [Acetobacteraceae bacterium]|jgi:hypothetical protein
MQVLRLCLAVACLLVWDCPAIAADPQPAGQVERVPPEDALAILGSPVTEPDGKAIGRLVDILVDASGTPQAGVIDVGGFMGVGARKIAVHWSVLHFAPANPKQPITLDLTLDQIKVAPEYRNPAKPALVVLPAKPPGETSSDAAVSATTGGETPGSGTAGGATGVTGDATGGSGTIGSGATGSLPTRSAIAGSSTTGNATTGSNAAGNAATESSTTGSESARQTPPRSQ